MTGRTDELERFKGEINLVEFAQSLGYEVIKRESSRACAVMKRGGDKIVVATDKADGHGIYFNVGDQADSGSIVDFAQRRLGGNLGAIRKELRGWCYTPKAPSPKRRPPEGRPERPEPVERDRAVLLARWHTLEPYKGTYLTSVRGLDADLVAAWRVRQDASGNACFPHWDGAGVSGWEIKNQGFTGFAAGGRRGWTFVRLDTESVRQIVLAESSIDVISWAQLHGQPGTAYVSSGGAVVPDQLVLIAGALERSGASRLILATDADLAGDAMAEKIAAIVPAGVEVVRDRPTSGKDWNDVLRAASAVRLSPAPRSAGGIPH